MTHPPAAPTMHPLRCEYGCESYSYDPVLHVRKCNGIVMPGCEGDRCVFEWIKTHGCASHSSANQHVADVVKELERLAEEEEQMKKESKTNEPWMGHAYAGSAYLKAIALLKDGVERK